MGLIRQAGRCRQKYDSKVAGLVGCIEGSSAHGPHASLLPAAVCAFSAAGATLTTGCCQRQWHP